MAKKKEIKEALPKVHKDLAGYNININSFGEISTTIDIDKINQFLNTKVDDKKLRNRDESDKK